jgi:hypothetical protein
VALLLIFLLRLWSTVAASAPKRECTVQRSSSKKRFGHFAGTKKMAQTNKKWRARCHYLPFRVTRLGRIFASWAIVCFLENYKSRPIFLLHEKHYESTETKNWLG